MAFDRKLIEELVKALGMQGYHARPGRLRQGSLHSFVTDENGNIVREATEEEYDRLYEAIEKAKAK